MTANVQYKKRRVGDKHFVSVYYLAKYKYFAFILSFLVNTNFIFGDFTNKRRPFDKILKSYVFLYLVSHIYFIQTL